MSWDLTRENVSTFFRSKQHPIIGYLICLFLAFLFQLTTVGFLIVIAGGIAGFLLKEDVKAILITFAAGTTVWLVLFGLIHLLQKE